MLAQQPFETVMQTGFKDYLNHLTTKLTVRRSDIIVSSTLSITLTPIDDGFVPTHFALIESAEIWDYVMLKNAYRSSLVSSNSNLASPCSGAVFSLLLTKSLLAGPVTIRRSSSNVPSLPRLLSSFAVKGVSW